MEKSFDNSCINFKYFNSKKNLKTLFIAEHSGDKIPNNIKIDKNIINNNLHFDKNSKCVSEFLNSKFNSIFLYSLYSHLLCDPCKNVSDINLIPEVIDNFKLDFNKLNFQEQEDRISFYYIGFHISLRYLQDNYNFDYIISIHSHTNNNYDFIISYYYKSKLSNHIQEYCKNEKYKILINPNDKQHHFLPNDDISTGLPGRKRQGVLISFFRDKDLSITKNRIELMLNSFFDNI